MDRATTAISEKVKRLGINLAVMSTETNIPYQRLYGSITQKRAMKADEFLMSCKFLGINPLEIMTSNRA